MTLGGSFKGWLGEVGAAYARHLSLDDHVYLSRINVVVKARSGTTQIDHIIFSRYGVFVIETKNMTGWIFGNEKSRTWTQSIYGRKYSFLNPLRQNYRHIRVLEEILRIPRSHFHSIVCFVGDAQFKTQLPSNVMSGLPYNYIRSKTAVLMTNEKAAALANATAAATLTSDTFVGRLSGEVGRTHLASLRDRHSSTTVCPTCGGDLVVRTAGRGSDKGSRFYGCKRYPDCRYTRKL